MVALVPQVVAWVMVLLVMPTRWFVCLSARGVGARVGWLPVRAVVGAPGAWWAWLGAGVRVGVIGLPLRLWHRHGIVAGRCCRPHGLVRIFSFVVGLEWPGFIVVVVVVVVVIGVGLVRSSRSLCFRGIQMPGLVDPVVFDFRLSGTRFVPGWP